MKHQPRIIIIGPPESRHTQRKYGFVRYLPPAGATKIPCDQCGKKFWIGPKQIEAIAKQECDKLCMVCAAPLVRNQQADIAHLGGDGGSYERNDGTSYGPRFERN